MRIVQIRVSGVVIALGLTPQMSPSSKQVQVVLCFDVSSPAALLSKAPFVVIRKLPFLLRFPKTPSVPMMSIDRTMV
jgi:hypothetical protein